MPVVTIDDNWHSVMAQQAGSDEHSPEIDSMNSKKSKAEEMSALASVHLQCLPDHSLPQHSFPRVGSSPMGRKLCVDGCCTVA